MSVYSGFATRKQESFYNHLLSKLIEILTNKIVSTIPYQDIGQFIINSQREHSSRDQKYRNNEGDFSPENQIKSQQNSDIQTDDKMSDNSILRNVTQVNQLQIPTLSQNSKNQVFIRFDEKKWARQIVKLFKSLSSMEKSKYLEPHYSMLIKPIVSYCLKTYNNSHSDIGSSFCQDINTSNTNNNTTMYMDVVQEEVDTESRNSTMQFKKKSISQDKYKGSFSKRGERQNKSRSNSNSERKHKREGSKTQHQLDSNKKVKDAQQFQNDKPYDEIKQSPGADNQIKKFNKMIDQLNSKFSKPIGPSTINSTASQFNNNPYNSQQIDTSINNLSFKEHKMKHRPKTSGTTATNFYQQQNSGNQYNTQTSPKTSVGVQSNLGGSFPPMPLTTLKNEYITQINYYGGHSVNRDQNQNISQNNHISPINRRIISSKSTKRGQKQQQRNQKHQQLEIIHKQQQQQQHVTIQKINKLIFNPQQQISSINQQSNHTSIQQASLNMKPASSKFVKRYQNQNHNYYNQQQLHQLNSNSTHTNISIVHPPLDQENALNSSLVDNIRSSNFTLDDGPDQNLLLRSSTTSYRKNNNQITNHTYYKNGFNHNNQILQQQILYSGENSFRDRELNSRILSNSSQQQQPRPNKFIKQSKIIQNQEIGSSSARQTLRQMISKTQENLNSKNDSYSHEKYQKLNFDSQQISRVGSISDHLNTNQHKMATQQRQKDSNKRRSLNNNSDLDHLDLNQTQSNKNDSNNDGICEVIDDKIKAKELKLISRFKDE
eukprot:403375745